MERLHPIALFALFALVAGGLAALALVGFGVLAASAAGEGAVPACTDMDPSLPRIEIDGYPFHGETFGPRSGPLILVLHGGPGYDYRSVLPLKALADPYFMVFYDQRGAGLSPRVAEGLTVDRYLEDSLAIADSFKPGEPFIVIGHSWGAMQAAALIGRHGHRVKAAVLAEPAFFDHEGMLRWYRLTGMGSPAMILGNAGSFLSAWRKSLGVHGPDRDARADRLMESLLQDASPSHPLALYYKDGDVRNGALSLWRFGARANSAVQASGMGDDGKLKDLAAGAEAWTGKALFLTGSLNRLIGEDHQRGLMERFRFAELAVVPDAGHTMIGEQPEASVRAIRAWLDAL